MLLKLILPVSFYFFFLTLPLENLKSHVRLTSYLYKTTLISVVTSFLLMVASGG